MEIVAFITTESGDDLIVSFAVQAAADASEIESLILLRTPKYEPLLPECERGVRVSFERHPDDEDDFLMAVEYAAAAGTVRVRTRLHESELDVGKVEAKELKRMSRMLHKLNYDRKFETAGF